MVCHCFVLLSTAASNKYLDLKFKRISKLGFQFRTCKLNLNFKFFQFFFFIFFQKKTGWVFPKTFYDNLTIRIIEGGPYWYRKITLNSYDLIRLWHPSIRMIIRSFMNIKKKSCAIKYAWVITH
jgi:hypothetical protein